MWKSLNRDLLALPAIRLRQILEPLAWRSQHGGLQHKRAAALGMWGESAGYARAASRAGGEARGQGKQLPGDLRSRFRLERGGGRERG